MLPEPAHTTAQAAIAGFSAMVLALTGVTYLGLLWGLIGAVVALMFTPPVEDGTCMKCKVFSAVFGGMVMGAVAADFGMWVLVSYVSEKIGEGVHLAMAFLIGAGSKRILAAAIDLIVRALENKAKAGGS